MNDNERHIHQFYQAFQQKDYATMQLCYAEQATFTDPAFGYLVTTEVRAMWKMLCLSAHDLKLEYEIIHSQEEHVNARWTATYTFSATKRKVINHIHSRFVLHDGRIIEQIDTFDFHQWAKQALGFSGLLLGWTSFFQQKVKTQARKRLSQFMAKDK